ncbi:MAG TPA: AraC family transcriptional regulator [Fimbriimonadaceae bacterium]|nr:AraC family transcriptional regulator [Fimbriimonadaceae bacterium]
MNETVVKAGAFKRPTCGVKWAEAPGLSGGVAWRSHGGAGDKHPDRALPRTLEVEVPLEKGRLLSVSIYGVFALHTGPEVEPIGVAGATVRLARGERTLKSWNLVHGSHYTDSTEKASLFRPNGEGTLLETVGAVEIDGRQNRVDRLTLEVPGGIGADRLIFHDNGTAASFIVFDVLFDFEPEAVCPFKGHGGHVALEEVGTLLHMRDRGRFDKALSQVAASMRACGEDLDEARSLALTFLAAVVAALLATDAPKSSHKALLMAARQLDACSNIDDAIDSAVTVARDLTDGVLLRDSATGDALIDEALKYVGKHFRDDIDDAKMAKMLRLSTSHFRHLFREATCQPFHRYLVALRLEKARELILQSEMPVSEVAQTVGFVSPAHFSRAFTKRFGVAPSALRGPRR